MEQLKIDELNQLHTEGKAADKEILAEFRSNILLIAGEHFSKRLWDTPQVRGRNITGATQTEQYRLRITKNYLHRAHRIYVTSILTQSPSATVTPRVETELHDQKSASLNESVWQYAKDKYKVKSLTREWCSDFCGIGESAVKIFFDPSKGALKGYEPTVDEMGQEYVDEMGQPIPDESKPVFTGEFVFERLFAQNIFRPSGCQQMKNAAWLGVEKLEDSKLLKARYKGDKKKLGLITESNEEFVVFDTARNGYGRDKNQTLLLEYYFKPCLQYPKGYYYITTKAGILEEGELPNGIFPIRWAGFDEHPTKPRATSLVKVARPWQAEINRSSSQVAMHSITLGEDKLLYQAGTKVAQGALLPGIRGITYNGAPPVVLPGRVGEQFFEYIAIQEQEMNRALMLDFLNEDKNIQLDPMAMLFKSMDQGQKFNYYSVKFGEFLVEVCELFLELAKFYLEGDELIAAIGKSEVINIAEFKATTPLNHSIKVQEQGDTIESKLGKQVAMQHILQFVGPQLDKEDIGKMINEMPFGNWRESFSNFTLNDKNVKNDFLAIERGEQPAVSENDDSKYVLTQIAKRKKERDFRLLPQPVQDMYVTYEQYHQEKMAAEATAIKAAQAEYIPISGSMIGCDMYNPESDPKKVPKRVRVPYQALEWLLAQLEKQGSGMAAMEQMNSAQAAQAIEMAGAQQQPGGQPPQAGQQGPAEGIQ